MVGSAQTQFIGLIDPARAGAGGVFVFAGFVHDFFDPDVARGAIDVRVENAQEYPYLKCGPIDKVVSLNGLNIGYPAVSRRQQ
jgi:hypothetical protein